MYWKSLWPNTLWTLLFNTQVPVHVSLGTFHIRSMWTRCYDETGKKLSLPAVWCSRVNMQWGSLAGIGKHFSTRRADMEESRGVLWLGVKNSKSSIPVPLFHTQATEAFYYSHIRSTQPPRQKHNLTANLHPLKSWTHYAWYKHLHPSIKRGQLSWFWSSRIFLLNFKAEADKSPQSGNRVQGITGQMLQHWAISPAPKLTIRSMSHLRSIQSFQYVCQAHMLKPDQHSIQRYDLCGADVTRTGLSRTELVCLCEGP